MQQTYSGMERLAAKIVDGRRIIMVIFLIAAVFSVFSAGWVDIETNLYNFLPSYTETSQGIDAMEGEFVTYGTARVMLKNSSWYQGRDLANAIAEIDGVNSVSYDDTEAHYKDICALIDVTFDGETEDEVSEQALLQIRELVADNDDCYIYTEVGIDMVEMIGGEMLIVGILAVAIVIALLLLTSRSFMEVPVLLITFGAAAILNLGTNFVYGKISYVSNSVTLILQLALAIDYAVILCNRYSEERHEHAPREAMIYALSKAIPEISASSLTTIGGLVAMMFMRFGLGLDLGMVLVKAIMLSMLSVFLLMPGVMISFSGAIDKTRHRSFMPRIDGIGKFAWVTRKIIPPLFVLVVAFAFFGANRCPLAYYYQDLYPVKLNESQIAHREITEVFGSENMMAVVVPSGSYQTEAAMIEEISQNEHVTRSLGLACVEVLDHYRLGDEISIDEFCELAELDRVSASALFAYYGTRNDQYEILESDLHSYKVPLVDLFLFLHELVEEGTVELDEDKTELVASLYDQLTDAKAQLEGRNYSRMLVYVDVPADSDEAHELVEWMHGVAESYYGEDVFITGNSTCSRDLSEAFSFDTILISVLSAVFVVIVIMFTFKSFALPFLLIVVIQGSIWINFSVPYLTDDSFFFVGYLIVSAIQMGANIDYAIVISNRYLELRKELEPKEAMTGALNGALPTLVTSGSILACAGLLIGLLTSETTTSSIGMNLGRGTFISLLLVLFVLPQVLLLGDKLISKTRFGKKRALRVPGRFKDDFESIARSHAER